LEGRYWDGRRWSTGWKTQEDDLAPAIAIFADGTELAIADVLHGDVMSKSVVRGKPSAAAKKEQKKGNYVTSSKEHPTFGIMKITSQLDQQKIRFACISSAERKCACQVTSSQVPDLETGTKIMTLVMDKMIDNPDKTDKKDIYKLRDEIREEVLKTMNWTPAKDTVTAKKKGKGTDIEESEKGKEGTRNR
jgi:hypothetical protein